MRARAGSQSSTLGRHHVRSRTPRTDENACARSGPKGFRPESARARLQGFPRTAMNPVRRQVGAIFEGDAMYAIGHHASVRMEREEGPKARSQALRPES